MKDFSLKLVRVIDHPNNDGDRNEQIAFLQGPKTCFDLCAVETESYTRAEFTKDAELIVTAVNNFDRLKEALEQCSSELARLLHQHYHNVDNNGILQNAKQLLESIK